MPRLLHGQNIRIQAQINARFHHFSGYKMPNFVIKTAQHLFAAVELSDFGAQTVEDGRKLARNVAAAYHHQPCGKWVEVKQVVGCNHMLTTFHLRHKRRSARDHQDVFCTEALGHGLRRLTQINLHCVAINQLGKAIEHSHTRATQELEVNAIQAGNFRVPIGLQRLPIQRRRLTFPTEPM